MWSVSKQPTTQGGVWRLINFEDQSFGDWELNFEDQSFGNWEWLSFFNFVGS